MKKFLCGAVAFTLATSTYAASLTVGDFSFENLSTNVVSPLLGGSVDKTCGSWRLQVSGLLNAGVSIGFGHNLGGPTPSHGTSHARIRLPIGLLNSADLSQTLPTNFVPYTVYELKLKLAKSTALNLLTGSSLKLKAGTNVVASLSGVQLAQILGVSLGYEAAALKFVTTNIAPVGNIGVEFSMGGVASVGGDVFLDGFELLTTPVSTTMTCWLTPGNNRNTMTVGGHGGPPLGTYYVVRSSNLNLGSENWTIIATNHFDAVGNYEFEIPINADPLEVFRLRLP